MNIKRKHIVFVACLVLVLVQSCKKDVDKTNTEAINTELEDLAKTKTLKNVKANVKLLSVNDSKVFGSAIFKEVDNGVVMIALVNDLSNGIYKMFIINGEDCSVFDENESLHWNPTHKKHGVWGDESGHHRGDIGALKIDDLLKNGTLSFSTNEWCLGCDDDTKNILGKSLIVIKENDDSASNIKGNTILSCGLIEKQK